MARYRGPRLKVCRSVGAVLPGLTTAVTLDRPFPPGEHGAKRRKKPSDFKIRMTEKQKARWHFGVLEKQFRRYVVEATRMRGPSGHNLLMLLQSRLDNVAWRMGLAPTIPAARQLIVHCHVQVNGKTVDRPSFHVKAGDLVSVKEKSRVKPFVTEVIEGHATVARPAWIEFDPAKVTGKILSAPDKSDLPFELNEQAIIEFYSQKL